jgi:uncharacterized protein
MIAKFDHIFWTSRLGLLLQIVIVLIPSAIFINSGTLILIGLFISVFLSWIGLRLQKRKWSDVGLKKPFDIRKVCLISIFSTIVLIPFTFLLRHFVTSIIHQSPNLVAFKAVKGNPLALLIGLGIVWIFGAFGEEMFFRGFLLNSLYKLLPNRYFNNNFKWGLSLLITSVLVGFGHSYQGVTGMILTGIIGCCFGLIYLKNKQNLWANILAHGFYDTVAFVIVFLGLHLDKILK